MKALAFLALSTSLVLAALQACSSADPHPTVLSDCTGATCTVPTGGTPTAKDAGVDGDAADSSVTAKDAADAADASDAG